MGKAAALAALCLAALAGAGQARQEWAVLVCGSRGFYNYRHQADVCHAYALLRRRGIPEERIITMMYDDAAGDSRNPYPGKLFNRPTAGANPVDVYEGCKVDYRGGDVTPENFVAVLTGDVAALAGKGNGRVLNSTAEDDVFVNFVDHGAPGLVAFPRGELHAADLMDALDTMHRRKAYRNLVFYLEACESGSMFAQLPEGRNIYAVSAANARESSWATYCPPNDDSVGGMHLGTCLGDEFSVNWMEDTDLERRDADESLAQQFTRVSKKTRKSHVLNFGDVQSISPEDISDFLGVPEDDEHPLARAVREEPINVDESALVDSRDVALVSTFYRYLRQPSRSNKAALDAELSHRSEMDELFHALASHLLDSDRDVEEAMSAVPPREPTEWECHRQVHAAFRDICAPRDGWSDYGLKYSATLLTLCEKLAPRHSGAAHIAKIRSSLFHVCGVPTDTA